MLAFWLGHGSIGCPPTYGALWVGPKVGSDIDIIFKRMIE